MYIPKRYGESRFDGCPFCGKQAILKSPQKLLVCNAHKDSILPEIKCVCGSFLVLMEGKFGPFFNCINCGNLNLKKGLEMLQSMQHKQKFETRKEFSDPYVSDPGKYPGFDYGIR